MNIGQIIPRNFPSRILFSILFIILFLFFTNNILPPMWPDEVLFSNPASELSVGRPMRTPVLAGLISGMDRVTLWNSPLYPVLLSLVYRVTGESLFAGRSFSFVILIFVIFVFEKILRKLSVSIGVRTLALFMLSMDLTFIRAGNIIRMDILALLFMLTSFYIMLAYAKNQKRSLATLFLAGVSGGLGGLTHPIAVYFVLLAPWLLLTLNRAETHLKPVDVSPKRVLLIKEVFVVGGGAFAGISPWLFYILPNREYFVIQFMSQLSRKSHHLSDIATGSIFAVYSSQYGGHFYMMLYLLISIALLFCVAFVWIFYLYKREHNAFVKSNISAVTGAAMIVLTVVLLSSEAWYAVHVAPYVMICFALLLSELDKKSSTLDDVQLSSSNTSLIKIKTFFTTLLKKRRLTYLLLPFMFFFPVSLMTYTMREVFIKKTPSYIASILADMEGATESCKSMYVKAVPDPYFFLKEKRVGLDYYEFIPSRLRGVEDADETLVKKYRHIDCFLIQPQIKSEPALDLFLEQHKNDFRVTTLPRRGTWNQTFLYIKNENLKK